jgi:hypothetical protein
MKMNENENLNKYYSLFVTDRTKRQNNYQNRNYYVQKIQYVKMLITTIATPVPWQTLRQAEYSRQHNIHNANVNNKNEDDGAVGGVDGVGDNAADDE